MTEQEKRAWTRTYILNARINAYKDLPELRFNPYHDPRMGRFTTKEGNCLANKTDNKNKNSDISDRKAYSENNAKNGLTSENSSGIMSVGSEKMTISSIEQPIEQQHTGKGNPNAILMLNLKLNNRQKNCWKAYPNMTAMLQLKRKLRIWRIYLH